VVADLTLDKKMLQELIAANYDACSGTRDDRRSSNFFGGSSSSPWINSTGHVTNQRDLREATWQRGPRTTR
jgi:hypothetical protein